MRIVVTGASGRLGSELLDRLTRASRHEVRAWSGATRGTRAGLVLRPVDLADETAIDRALEEDDPEAILHAGCLSTAEAVRREPERARAVNVEATRRLAGWASARERRLVFTSTDLVFDGSRSWYGEDDPARPVLAYGQTKLDAETHVLGAPRGLVARLCLLFGAPASAAPDFIALALAALRRGEPRSFFVDEFRTPLPYSAAAEALVRLIESDATGIVHVGGRERLSRFDLMRRAAIASGIDPALVLPGRQADVVLAEPRPADVSLATTRLAALLPDLERPPVEAVLAAGVS